ncbi:hypothetical protein L1987_35760 [Smallanthus sonchifolius]|uniref:Uncharacterized protein n=1 Tax=Smallanthus sonchifolius TaxID=185202 RepID=A0ACB9HDB1_9ASTR|nr:hypothetical protein L1987_35760 [Smallanthus sonchifolius]
MGSSRIFSLCPTQTTQILTFHCQPETHHASFSCRSLKLRQWLRWQKLGIKCGGGDELEVKRKDEMKIENEDILMEDSNINSAEEVKEKVELMEMEAIMGKDDGKEAMDYKRRAGIFYKSSEMFQANKDQPHHCT